MLIPLLLEFLLHLPHLLVLIGLVGIGEAEFEVFVAV